MKYLLLPLLFICSLQLSAQDKFFTRNGHVSFFSEAPLENIEAHNHQVTSILNVKTGEIVFSGLMKGFEFEKALMQEHFNESYAESDKYPKTKFNGQIVDFENLDMQKDGSHNVTVKGDLSIHGVSKEYTVSGQIERKGKEISALAKFDVNVEEHGIKIPAGKINNIAKVVEVTADLKYQPYER